ncbi:MAG TPA: hypothetical protein VH247_05190 [Thermoleophilaceae bacterium]|nr:hypothetical protein [Thermoleophilaceae bacterium]
MALTDEVVIDRRFRGPPESGQGGYSCGLVAERIDADSATVTLRSPPPLDRQLQIERDSDVVKLLDGEILVAEGSADPLDLDVPDPVSLDAARHASEQPFWADLIHPFPGCFGCGLERNQQEAVAIWMGDDDDSGLMAGIWTPSPEFAGDDGAVTKLVTWAALDCPTATGANLPLDGVSVLGRLSCRAIAPIEPGEPHTVVAWPISDDGRKHLGGCAIHSADGRLCACSAGLWIELRDPSTMGAKTRS